jgi:hypothetical protein
MARGVDRNQGALAGAGVIAGLAEYEGLYYKRYLPGLRGKG